MKNIVTDEEIFETYDFNGFCGSKDGVYIIENYDDVKGYLNYVDVKTGNTVQSIHTISEPKGIAEYRGSLYVYSLTDRSVYRLESTNETLVYPLTSFRDIENLFIYTTSGSSGSSSGQVDKVYLSEVSDEIFIKKKAEVTQDKIENTVLSHIPDAQISWINDDVCIAIAREQSIQDKMSVFMADDDMISVRPAYIRKVYKELMELYPVEQVALYGFTDEIIVKQMYDNHDEVDALLASLGFQVESAPIDPYGGTRWHQIFVPKESDIIAIANSLYETGFFYASSPRQCLVVRDTYAEPVDPSGLDYIYDSGGEKTYYYKLPGHFMITKDRETDKAQIEAIINRYLTDPYYEWVADDRCQVETDESLIDEAIARIRSKEAVNSANRSYLKQSDYESTLLKGTGYPSTFNFNQEIILMFKDGVLESVKDSLSNAFNISSINDNIIYTSWTAPKTADIFKICNSLSESGYVKYAEPNWISGFKIIFCSSGSGTNGIEKTEVSKTSEFYYDLLGRRINSPEGFTIVVTRYSDGTVRTEKRLY